MVAYDDLSSKIITFKLYYSIIHNIFDYMRNAPLVRWSRRPPDPPAEGWQFNPHCERSV